MGRSRVDGLEVVSREYCNDAGQLFCGMSVDLFDHGVG
jgi:hypothetical protein